MVSNPPAGYRTVNPLLMAEEARGLLRFIEQGLGGVVREFVEGPGGTVMHCAMAVGDSMVILGDATAEHPPTCSMLYLYIDDVDGTYASALAAGGESIQPPRDQPYGDRNAAVRDPAGNGWWLAAHVEEVSEAEVAQRYAALEG